MIGNPKFKLGDTVEFELEGRKYHGTIYIIDKYGTFENNSDVSYDIMVIDYGENHNHECLFKHITERLVSKY